jgi:hypothetical protein
MVDLALLILLRWPEQFVSDSSSNGKVSYYGSSPKIGCRGHARLTGGNGLTSHPRDPVRPSGARPSLDCVFREAGFLALCNNGSL